VGQAAHLLGLRVGGLHLLVLEQRGHQVAVHGEPVSRRARQLLDVDAMAHQASRSRSRSISERSGKFSMRMPNERPMLWSTSLISLSDLRPKFLVLSISDSLRCTSS